MSEETPPESNGYLVGYGKPPAEHRFKKGQSGNPKGRRKAKKTEPLRGYDRPTQLMILEEAYRPISLREGDKVIELPAIQAVIRSMSVSAMKGNRLAQKLVTEIVQKIEQDHFKIQYENIEHFTKYKESWSAEIERCRKAGLPEPELVPHPDDIIIDYRKGKLEFAGPISKEEKVRWDKALARRDEAQEDINHFAEWLEKDPEFRDYYLEQIEFEKRMFNLLNNHLPERYKKKLIMPPLADGESSESAEEAA